LRRSAESEALDLKLHQATAASLASDQESSLQSLRLARQLAVSENETLRPLIDQARHELAAQLTVNAALLGAVQLRDTTLEGLRTQLASAEAECQSVSQLLARQDEERKRLTEVQTALAEAEARCASSQAEADAARLQLESVQTQRMDFDAALMLKEAQANAWERECRNAKNRADTAVRKSATDAQALESLKAELAACQTELAAVNGAPTASAAPTADPALAQRMKDLETELAVVSESHARLESELAETKALASRAEDLSEQLGTVEAELAALKLEPAPSPSGDLETLLQDLDTLTRERNRLAAEVAALKSTGTRPDSV
jgi:chromosome segregation ATPase